MQTLHLLKLVAAAVGQAILLAFAWGFLAVVLLHDSLPLPLYLAGLLELYPSELTLIVTGIATVLSIATTFCFSAALKEALRHRLHEPISLFRLASGIAVLRGDYIVGFRDFSSRRFSSAHLFMTSATIVMFVLTKFMVSCWSTLLAPTPVAFNTASTGSELDLNSSYFELQLQNLTAGGGIFTQGNSTQIIDIGSLLSGIVAAQYSFGAYGILDLNGVLYNGSTGGVLPAIPGYNSSILPAYDITLSFGGPMPTGLAFRVLERRMAASNYTVLQHGLTADVTCSSAPDLESQTSSQVPISAFTGNDTWLTAETFTLICTQGNSAQQSLAVLASDGNTLPAVGYVTSLVCPYPVGQSGLDWTQFNVTTQGFQKYQFLQTTTCQITPKLTTSLVTYAFRTLNATVVDSTPLNSSNANLALFLASLVDYLSTSAQSLVSNTLGDALYSIASPNNTNLNNSGSMNRNLTAELEQYWRGIIEFSGTYLRASFSTVPNPTREGLVSINGTQTTSTLGWNKRSPIFLYTVLPVTFFGFLTYAAFIYSLHAMMKDWDGEKKFAEFDPSNPIHLIMVSSTRESGEKARNLEGEKLSGFSNRGIENNKDVRVKLVDVLEGEEAGSDTGVRKRFELVKASKTSTTPSHETPASGPAATKGDADARDLDLERNKD